MAFIRKKRVDHDHDTGQYRSELSRHLQIPILEGQICIWWRMSDLKVSWNVEPHSILWDINVYRFDTSCEKICTFLEIETAKGGMKTIQEQECETNLIN